MQLSNHVRWLVGDYWVRTGLLTAAVLTLIQWIIFGIYAWQLPPEIPFYYSLPSGSSQLAGSEWFLFLPSLNLGFLLINTILLRLQQHLVQIYLQLFTWLTTLICFLITIAMVHTIWLVL